MIISTTETIPSREISEILGIARGSTVRAGMLLEIFLLELKT
jgi:uncharacterized protein YbjQ (UPF0145 family)